MKKVLITGANSYIGMSFEAYVQAHYNDCFEVDTIDMQTSSWKESSFSKYDVVFHVAGIAHRKETKENRDLFFQINRDLAIETARKAKKEGVKHFIFLSSMSVYGMLVGEIKKDTIPKPNSAYGESKLEAEERLFELADEAFKVSVLRPPMVYGKNCKGNYQLLRKFALTISIFPQYENRRSMIYIDNLSSVVMGIIQYGATDIYLPQNVEYMSSAEIIQEIGIFNDKKVYMSRVFNPVINVLAKHVTLFKKVFGSLIYEKSSNVPLDWIKNMDNVESIRRTELAICEPIENLQKKKVLVLMSTYNGEKYLKSQILSILNQDFEGQIDIRVRDDGSTDGTLHVLKHLQKHYPDRIAVISGENKGYNASFFELINSANGYDYYAISDQDDIWLKEKVRVACERMSKEEDDIPLLYASTSYLVNDSLRPYGTTRKKIREFTIYNTIIQNICPGHTQVMNNAMIKLIQGNIDVKQLYVYDSWIMNVAMLCGKIVFDNNSYTYYRQHNTNQLGSGRGTLGQLFASKKRIDGAHGKRYKTQALYFVKMYEKILKEKGYFLELNNYVTSETLIDRFKYIFTGKLYRQKKIETIAFYVAMVLGKY